MTNSNERILMLAVTFVLITQIENQIIFIAALVMLFIVACWGFKGPENVMREIVISELIEEAEKYYELRKHVDRVPCNGCYECDQDGDFLSAIYAAKKELKLEQNIEEGIRQ